MIDLSQFRVLLLFASLGPMHVEVSLVGEFLFDFLVRFLTLLVYQFPYTFVGISLESVFPTLFTAFLVNLHVTVVLLQYVLNGIYLNFVFDDFLRVAPTLVLVSECFDLCSLSLEGVFPNLRIVGQGVTPEFGLILDLAVIDLHVVLVGGTDVVVFVQ